MKPLKPRTILLVGLSAFFLAFIAPFAYWSDSTADLYAAAMGGLLFTTLVGLPIFGAMAWGANQAHAPMDDPMTLYRRYRYIERFFACAGMLSLGYLMGWSVHFPIVYLDKPPAKGQLILSLALLALSMLVMMVVAIAKIGLNKRLEILKERIASQRQAADTSGD